MGGSTVLASNLSSDAHYDYMYHVTIMWLSHANCVTVMWLTMWLPGGDITPSPGVGNHVEVMTSSDPCRRGAQLSLKFSCPVKEIHSFLERHGVMVRQRSYVDKGNNVTPLFKHWEDCRNALKHDLLPSSLPLGMRLALYSSLFLPAPATVAHTLW